MQNVRRIKTVTFTMALLTLIAFQNAYAQTAVTPAEARAIAKESYTIHFGGCDDGRMNCIPITPAWNYAIRIYEPREEILDNNWIFSSIEPVK
jgi:hypothetical protein